MYQEFITGENYKAKKVADKVGHHWDRLIKVFTANVIAGTSVKVAGNLPTVSSAERGLRIMTLERRVVRRILGAAFIGAIRESERRNLDRFTRLILPQNGFNDPESGYVILILAYHADVSLSDGYAQYRSERLAMLEAYCFVALHDNRHLKRVVGIALDAPSRVAGRRGGSEKLVVIEIDKWTPETERRVEEFRRHSGIFDPARVETRAYSSQEYPTASPMTRQQRHAAERKARKPRR